MIVILFLIQQSSSTCIIAVDVCVCLGVVRTCSNYTSEPLHPMLKDFEGLVVCCPEESVKPDGGLAAAYEQVQCRRRHSAYKLKAESMHKLIKNMKLTDSVSRSCITVARMVNI